MNRLQKRASILSHEEYNDIYKICLDLRMSWNGSGDPYPKELENKYLQYLKIILETWEDRPTNIFEMQFDNAIRDLVTATLALYKFRQLLDNMEISDGYRIMNEQ